MPLAPSRMHPVGRSKTAASLAARGSIDPHCLEANQISLDLYGDPSSDDLSASIRTHGILVPLVIAPGSRPDRWVILSGHRRWACACALGIKEVPYELRLMPSENDRRRLILEYNRQRQKTFSQFMREADLLESLLAEEAYRRRLLNLRRGSEQALEERGTLKLADSRDFDDRANHDAHPGIPERGPGRAGRTDATVAELIGLGGKDLYRQARAIWRTAGQGDVRASSSVTLLDAGTKTVHAAYKDLRRRDRFTTNFRPTPYDVWSFRHDRAFGIPHPGSIPPAIIAHTLHYFSPPGGLVVDPMAGGGTTLDVCESMGRHCLAYDLEPARPDIRRHDVRNGFPPDAQGADLVFCDPPYHTMLAQAYSPESVSGMPLNQWVAFLHELTRHAFNALRPGGYLALLLAPQTEKDLPAGYGYLDHTFLAYTAAIDAGFLPERRISCPMAAAYLPQHVRQARIEGRLLGQVRDLLVTRKPASLRESETRLLPLTQKSMGGLPQGQPPTG